MRELKANDPAENAKDKNVVQFTHVSGTRYCPRVCSLPECPEAQLTKIFVLC